MADLQTSGFGAIFNELASRQTASAQTSWAIDATLGNDNNEGTPAAPLKTMAEFNDRMQGVRVQGASTLQLVGDVIDEPLQLAGVRFKPTTSLSVTGTRTQLGTGTISTVTALGVGGTTFPWRFVTTGIVWTSIPSNALIITASGRIAWIRDVIDANTVEVGAVTSSTFAVQTPTAEAFTVFSLSRALAP